MEKTCITCRFAGHKEKSCMATPCSPKYTDGKGCPLYAMSALAFMQRVGGVQRRIVHMEERAAHYRDMSVRITRSMSGALVRGGGSASRIEENMDAFMDICRDIDHEAQKLRRILQETNALLARLCDRQEREILELRYISGYSWVEVADRMFMSERNVRRVHVRALEHVQREMDLMEYAVHRPGWNPSGGLSPQPLPNN